MLVFAAFAVIKKNKGKIESLKEQFMESQFCKILSSFCQLLLLLLVVFIGSMLFSLFVHVFVAWVTLLPALAALAVICRLCWLSYCLVREAHGNHKKNQTEVDLFGKPEGHDHFCIWIDENPFEIPSVGDQFQGEIKMGPKPSELSNLRKD
jgi:hypothetical protein